jgi:hypothetical protein
MAELVTKGETGLVIKAMIALQAELEPVKKNAKSHHGDFANLEAVMRALQPLLEKHKLAIIQMPVGSSGSCSLRTRIIHEDSSEVSSEITIPLQRANDPQAYGAAMTYGRRYALLCMFGMVTEDDNGDSASVSLEKILKEVYVTTTLDELSNIRSKHSEAGLLQNKFWATIYSAIHERKYAALVKSQTEAV